MSDVGGVGFTNFLAKGRSPQSAGVPASNRRHVWEMYADVRVVNKYLLLFSGLCSLAVAVMAAVILSIYTRPPYILTEDQGYVMWRTTEVFRLKPDMVSTYVGLVLSKIFTKAPGTYDLSSISNLVDPTIIDAFAGKEGGVARQSQNIRQFFDILEIRRLPKSQYEKYLCFVVKANMTTSKENRDSAGNLVTETKAETVFTTIWLDQVRPTPENPWGLVLVGMRPPPDKDGVKDWAGTTSLKEPVMPEKDSKPAGKL